MDEQDRRLQERMKSEGKIRISQHDFHEFVKTYFKEPLFERFSSKIKSIFHIK